VTAQTRAVHSTDTHCGTVASPHTAIRPVLRWAGSKRKLIPRLSAFWNDKMYSRYVEPFAGSCSLFFALAPECAMLADKNPELIEAYEVLRDRADELYREVASRSSSSDAYYRIRGLRPQRMSSLKRAARFIYLNRHCFNGIYRTNRDGHFNVPYATSRAGALPTLEDFRACASQLSKAQLRNWDFGTTLRYVRANDFVYLDPPYAVTSRRVFRAYGPRDFQIGDLERLFGHLERIEKLGAKFLLSYADCKEVRFLARHWETSRVAVRRNIAGFVASRRRAYEVLVTNMQMAS